MDYTLIAMTLPMSASGSIIGVIIILSIDDPQPLYLLIHCYDSFYHSFNLSEL